MLADETFLVLDCETTGLDVRNDRIVEVSALRFCAGQIIGVAHYLCDPQRPIPATASAIHMLTDTDVAGHCTQAEIDYRLDFFVRPGEIIVAHNATFDAAFFPVLHDRRWVCSMRAARHLWPDAPSAANQVLRFWLPLQVHLPATMMPHRSTADCLVTGALFRRELEEYERRFPGATMDDFLEYVESPIDIRVFQYGRKYRGRRIKEIPSDYLRWVLAQRSDHQPAMTVDPDTLESVRLELVHRDMFD